MNQIATFLYLATLALLPWGAIVPFPWLHENAQWSDALFALAALAWAAGVVVSRRWPRLRLVHAGLGLYLGWAALSLLAADPRPVSGPSKLLGVGMLVALMVVTSEIARRSGMPRAIGLTVAFTSLLAALAAVLGVGLSLSGRITPLVGTCGDLLPGPLWRAQAGFPHPNLLASYCIFASGVVAWPGAGLSRRLRRLAQAALTVTILLTFSRAILGFALAAAIRGATTPARRRWAWGLAAVLVVVMIGLTVVNVTFTPARPWEPQVLPGPSPRLEAVTTSLDTLAGHPLLGTGPGSSPGWKGDLLFDAHLTPLNIAATLGLPALLGFLLVPVALWRARRRPVDRALWGMLAGLALDGLGQDAEDFRHLWVAFGLADAERDETTSDGPGT
ncbi:MAG: O-antigen ligase family protein [Vicinamibacteria bacterium]